MHFFTDVIFGGLLGGAAVLAAVIVMRRAAERAGQEVEVYDDSPPRELVDA
jgi:membrane-associated phospholipid phosphatase